MNEWEVVGVLAALAALISGIAAPMLKLNASIVRLDTTLKSNTEQIKEFKRDNHEAHEEMYRRLNRTEKDIERHEGLLECHSKFIERLGDRE